MALQDKIRSIDDLKKQLDGLLPMPVGQQQKLDEKLRLEFHYNTNHIEGNTLTYGETKLAILFDQVSEGHSLREFEEMKASDVAYKYVQGLAKENDRPLTEAFIKELNQILLVREFYKEALTPDGQETRRLISIGEYKKHPNSVRLQNGELFHYATPAETPAMMTELIDWYRAEEEKKAFHPVINAAALHYRFVRIHPFDDGNGRISRLLMNYVLFKNGFPPVIIKSEDKPNYLRALNKADGGDVEAFIEYVAEQLKWSLELSVKAAKGEDIEEQQDWKKKLANWNKEWKNVKVIKKTKSSDTLKNVVANQISPFYQLIVAAMEIFKEHFINTKIKIDINNNSFEYDDFIENVNKYPYDKDVNLWVVFETFNKNQKNVFDVAFYLTCTFHQYNYIVTLLQAPTLIFEKFYHEEITNDDLEKTIHAIGRTLTSQIEEEIAKTKST